MKAPKDEQLRLVLQIIEHLLSNLYLIDLEAKNKLEGIISEYKIFKRLLLDKLSAFSSGEELYSSKIFDKDYRRVKDNCVAFEAELLTEISSGKFKALSAGAVKAKSADPKAAIVQHFVVV